MHQFDDDEEDSSSSWELESTMTWQRRCINPGGCLYETAQAIRWFPVLVVAAACGWGYYAYVVELSIKTVDNWPQRIVYIVGFHVLLVLFATSYFKTIFTPAGKPPKEFCFEGESLEEIRSVRDDERKLQSVLQRYVQQRKLPIRMRGFENSVRFCDKCICIKPDRSHHCSLCGQCVLKFDHHCPWVNNCVNFTNYKFFLLFLGYGFSFCLWIFFTDLPFFIDFWRTEFQGKPVTGGRFHLLFLVFVSGMFALSLSALFFYHLYLTAKNRSTVESFRAPLIDGRYEKNAFNHGIRANYREIFGIRKLFWLLPIYTTIGDGAQFDVSWNQLSSPMYGGTGGRQTNTTTTTNSNNQTPIRTVESIEIGEIRQALAVNNGNSGIGEETRGGVVHDSVMV